MDNSRTRTRTQPQPHPYPQPTNTHTPTHNSRLCIQTPDGKYEFDSKTPPDLEPHLAPLLTHAHECIAVCAALDRTLSQLEAHLSSQPHSSANIQCFPVCVSHKPDGDVAAQSAAAEGNKGSRCNVAPPSAYLPTPSVSVRSAGTAFSAHSARCVWIGARATD